MTKNSDIIDENNSENKQSKISIDKIDYKKIIKEVVEFFTITLWKKFLTLNKANQYAYVVATIITALVLWNKYFQFVPIFLTCYIFLYGNLSTRKSAESSSASSKTQEIINALQRQIEKRRDKIDFGNAEIKKINENKVLKSNFCYINTLKVLRLPKIWDLYGTLRQIVFEEREQYDASEQIKIFFEINEKENLKNIDFEGFDVKKFLEK